MYAYGLRFLLFRRVCRSDFQVLIFYSYFWQNLFNHESTL